MINKKEVSMDLQMDYGDLIMMLLEKFSNDPNIPLE